MVHGLPQIDHTDQLCDSCLAGKQRCQSFPNEAEHRTSFKLEVIQVDLCGTIMPPTPTDKNYFLLVDDVSRYMWLTLLNTKDEVVNAFVAFQSRAEAEAGRKLGTIWTDCGGEFTTCGFLDHCVKQGVQHHLTTPYTPE
jgi:hypothetical protein